MVTAGVRSRVRLRRRRLPRQVWPSGIARDYFHSLLELLNEARARLLIKVAPVLPRVLVEAAFTRGDVREDAGPRDIDRLVDEASEDFFDDNPEGKLDAIAKSVGRRVSAHQSEQLEKQVQAALGEDIPHWASNEGRLLEEFAGENIALAKTIPSRYFDDAKKEILSGVRAGETTREIGDRLARRFDVATSSAKLIANDQVGKLYSSLNKMRQTGIGVTRYRWRTQLDARVRDEHAAREGKTFDWSDPPPDGHPGEPINCRCFAEPVLEDILEDE